MELVNEFIMRLQESMKSIVRSCIVVIERVVDFLRTVKSRAKCKVIEIYSVLAGDSLKVLVFLGERFPETRKKFLLFNHLLNTVQPRAPTTL